MKISPAAASAVYRKRIQRAPAPARMFVLATAFAVFCTVRGAPEEDPLSRSSDYDYDAPAPGTYALPVVRPAADGMLLDSGKKAVKLRDLTSGKVTVLSFIYTRCAAPKACPYATGVLGELHERSLKDMALAKTLRLVSISFDPDYDTPQRLATYGDGVRRAGAGCEWQFATAKSRAELEPILAAYDQAVNERSNKADPQGPLYHTLRVFLIDPKGRIRNIYSSGTLDPRLVLADIKTLLLKRGRTRRRQTNLVLQAIC